MLMFMPICCLFLPTLSRLSAPDVSEEGCGMGRMTSAGAVHELNAIEKGQEVKIG